MNDSTKKQSNADIHMHADVFNETIADKFVTLCPLTGAGDAALNDLERSSRRTSIHHSDYTMNMK